MPSSRTNWGVRLKSERFLCLVPFSLVFSATSGRLSAVGKRFQLHWDIDSLVIQAPTSSHPWPRESRPSHFCPMTAGFGAVMSCTDEGKVHTRVLRLSESSPTVMPARTPPAVVITADDSDNGLQDSSKMTNGGALPVLQENGSSQENLSATPSEQQLQPGKIWTLLRLCFLTPWQTVISRRSRSVPNSPSPCFGWVVKLLVHSDPGPDLA